MKILLVCHHLPPKYKSGVEVIAMRQAHWLKNHGYTVELVGVEDIEANLPGGMEVKTEQYEGLTLNRLYFNRQAYPNVLEASHYNPDVAAWMEQKLAEFKPDVMAAHACYLLGVGVLEATRKLHIPTVMVLHDYWFLCQRITLLRPDGTVCSGKVTPEQCAYCLTQEKRRFVVADKISGGAAGKLLVQAAEKGIPAAKALIGGTTMIDTLDVRRWRLLQALAQVDEVIAPSRFLATKYEENGFPKGKIKFLSYGLDTTRVAEIRQASATRPAPNLAALRIGYLGQIAEHKGVHLLVEAVRQIDNPDLRLTIHGGMGRFPHYDEQLQRLAANDPRITFAGAYDQTELPAILANMDVLVVPSVWYENSPNVIMEGFTAGIPVLATNLGGMAEKVRHEQDGLLFNLADAPDLARQILRLQHEEGLYQRLQAGILPVKTQEEENRDYVELFQRLATSRQQVNS